MLSLLLLLLSIEYEDTVEKKFALNYDTQGQYTVLHLTSNSIHFLSC